MKPMILRTGEGVEFVFHLASPVSRALAWGLDFMVILSLSVFISQGSLALRWISPGIAQALLMLGLFVVPIGYHVGFEWLWRGQTPGKKVMGLRVIDGQGLRLRLSQVILRNLLRAVDSLPLACVLGGITAWWHPRGQRLGDLAAQTVVIVQPPRSLVSIPPPASSEQGFSLRSSPRLAALLRQRIPREMGLIAAQALGRREHLLPEARLALFRQMADHFRAVVPYPPHLTEGLTDEAYVRNVVSILFEPVVTSR
jgi:uncharacterized RDD family membrane protein YckC